MGNYIIGAILILIVIAALRSSLKHMKGEGGCCGGTGSSKTKKKKLSGKKIGEKIVEIEGMHCDNCKKRVEERLNEFSNAAATVNLKKKIARVSYSEPIADQEIIRAIEQLDFQVVQIQNREV